MSLVSWGSVEVCLHALLHLFFLEAGVGMGGMGVLSRLGEEAVVWEAAIVGLTCLSHFLKYGPFLLSFEKGLVH